MVMTAASKLVVGIATSEVTMFWWKRKGGSRSGGSGTESGFQFQNTAVVLP